MLTFYHVLAYLLLQNKSLQLSGLKQQQQQLFIISVSVEWEFRRISAGWFLLHGDYMVQGSGTTFMVVEVVKGEHDSV